MGDMDVAERNRTCGGRGQEQGMKRRIKGKEGRRRVNDTSMLERVAWEKEDGTYYISQIDIH